MKIQGVEITVSEFIESFIKAGVATAPFAGGVASLYGDWQNKIQYNNICDILNRITKRLEQLEERVNQTFLNSNDYTALLINLSFKGQNELSEDKRILYAEFAVACCLKDNSINDLSSLLDIISRIDKNQLKVLFYTEDDAPIVHNSHCGNLTHIYDRVKSDIFVEKELNYLMSLGLVTKINIVDIAKMLNAVGLDNSESFIGRQDEYYRTVLGNRLIEFLAPIIEGVL